MQPLIPIQHQRLDGEWVDIAVGYARTVPLQAHYDEQEIHWSEQHLLMRLLRAA